jgi:hypothetical protein
LIALRNLSNYPTGRWLVWITSFSAIVHYAIPIY